MNISFYTQGDDREVVSHISQTRVYEWYAQHHSSTNQARSARTIHDAVNALRLLADNTVRTIHLVGHGAGNNGDFVLIGSVDTSDHFLGTTPLTRYPFNLLQAPNGSDINQILLDQMARVVVRSGARVEMQFCWSARGGLQAAIANAFRARGITDFRISGTRDYFDFRVQAVAHSGNYRIRNVIGAHLPVVLH